MSKYNKVMVEIVDEQIDSIVIQELKLHLEISKDQLEDRKNKKDALAIYSHDKKADIALIEKDIACFEHVLSYYGVDNDI